MYSKSSRYLPFRRRTYPCSLPPRACNGSWLSMSHPPSIYAPSRRTLSDRQCVMGSALGVHNVLSICTGNLTAVPNLEMQCLLTVACSCVSQGTDRPGTQRGGPRSHCCWVRSCGSMRSNHISVQRVVRWTNSAESYQSRWGRLLCIECSCISNAPIQSFTKPLSQEHTCQQECTRQGSQKIDSLKRLIRLDLDTAR
jgi:hypothetical protein